ncbi:uncharacterized protein K452DRAFT_256275 [Aplosporella prunicola CBS 121167]|uniref:Uncharacterized protein n=1 Tax=Aplosporella prunicola CBS 121167 TaxID=1176127 RepID=A0A6A6B474_9PEZI|nr:uncharacterized protein K452DRAFT_256275 [Aplosporella prunicola CBS 121167]KAF2138636.1 hypothetical protein K452DRAFT_256275 [Aplosporella prunicola CBS 121167]
MDNTPVSPIQPRDYRRVPQESSNHDETWLRPPSDQVSAIDTSDEHLAVFDQPNDHVTKEVPVGLYETTSEEADPVQKASDETSWNKFWIVETISCTIAASALAAIIAVSATYNDHPLPQWPRPISINSLIAIFTAIFKAALVMPVSEGISQLKWHWFSKPRRLADMERFDIASRGPWGSLRLLFHLHQHYLASFGALIIVVALATDFFSQQIIHYYDCLQPVPNELARIPMTNNYTANGFHTGPLSQTLDTAMTVAIYTGILNPSHSISSAITVDCSTGNCTFPADGDAAFSSLAMCHSCSDISSEIRNDTKTYINYSLPSGGRLAYTNFSSTTAEQDFPSSLFKIENIMYQEEANCKKKVTDCLKPWAVQCSIKPCLNTYSANVSKSVYQEKVISSTPLGFGIGKNNAWNFSLATDSILRDGVWRSCNASSAPTESNNVAVDVNARTLQSYATFNGSKITDADIQWYPPECVWMVGHGFILAVNDFLLDLFDGESLSSMYGSANYTEGPVWLKRMYQDGKANLSSVNAFMEGLATEMTAQMRMHGDTPRAQWVQGKAMASQTCIRVRWAWISLPAALFCLTVLFLAFTMLRTRMLQQLGYWKSSIVALLFHGLDRESSERFASLSKRGDMYDTADRVKVQLRPDRNNSWKLVNVADSIK